MITKATSPGYLYAVTTDSTCLITDVDTRYNLCKAAANKQGMFVAIGGSVECSDDNVSLTQASATSGGTRFEVVTIRPATGEAGVIYLVPAANSTTENLYEEWVWVDDKWEQIGSAGINISNFAQLTTANTFSAANTFNGNLIKKTSTALADNSVLNRSEADARYGRLAADNTWQGDQTIASGRTLTIHHSATIVANSIRGNDDLKWLSFNDLSLTDIKTIEADKLDVTDIAPGNGSNIRMLGNVDVAKKIIVNEGLNIHPDSKLIVDTIATVSGQPLNIDGGLKLKAGLHASRITVPYIDTEEVHATGVLYTNEIGSHSGVDISVINDVAIHATAKLSTDEIAATTSNEPINIQSALNLQGHKISSVGSLFAGYIASSSTAAINIGSDVSLDGHKISSVGTLFADTLRPSMIAPPTASLGKIDVSEVRELQFINSNGNTTTLSGVKSLKNKNVTVSYDDRSTLQGVHSMFVQASEGIKVTSALSSTPEVTIAPSKIEAFQLDTILFGDDKYGLRITPESCQLFGINFNYGDVWSETNDKIKAQDATPIPGLDSASYFDTVKIRKPAVSIETTGIGSLSFDYANEAYIRTFPNDGGQGIFEFQAGNWVDSARTLIKRGPVDLRKASATELGPTSVLNMEEGDARWGGSSDVAIGALVPANFNPPNAAEVLEPTNIGNRGAYGIAIGPSVTANVYRDIAIGGWLSTSNGTGDNTLLGYNFSIQNRASKNIIIGQGNTTSVSTNNTIFIGHTSHLTISASSAVAINGDPNGDSAVAISGAAGFRSVAVGIDSVAGTNAVTIGEGTRAGLYGTALGAYSVAGENELVLQAGNTPAISMQLYGGTSWEDRNNTGYLRFVIAKLRENTAILGAADREAITISKPNLWSALDRAKYRGAQPYKYYRASAIDSIPALEPNSIIHIGAYTSGAAIDLSGITLAEYNDAITTAELWIEVTSAGTTITWPDGMLWPDETDPTVAPSFPGPEASTEVGYITQRIYCVTLRTQYSRGISEGSTSSSVLIASIVYAVDSKLLNTGAGGGGGS